MIQQCVTHTLTHVGPFPGAPSGISCALLSWAAPWEHTPIVRFHETLTL